MRSLTLLLIPLLFLSSCSIDWNDEKDAKIAELEKQVANLTESLSGNSQHPTSFYGKELGIAFDYNTGMLEINRNIPQIESDSYIVQHVSLGFDNYIQLLYIYSGSTIESVIKNAIHSKGKDPEKCEVINDGAFWGNQEYDTYHIDLINKEITYSQDELKAIEEADITAKQDSGPFNGEWEKKFIYNKHLVETCSEYAEPLGLGTSKSTPSIFIYNKAHTIVFLPGSADSSFYIPESIKLFNPGEKNI